MELVVKLSQDELNEIVSRHVFGESKKIRLEITEMAQFSNPVTTKYSDWYNVPDDHRDAKCPILLSAGQQLDVQLRSNGRVYAMVNCQCNWYQNGTIHDIAWFRIVNPENDWLHVPDSHRDAKCPITLDKGTQLEIIRRNGEVDAGDVNKWNISWVQEDNFRDIVKFRVIK